MQIAFPANRLGDDPTLNKEQTLIETATPLFSEGLHGTLTEQRSCCRKAREPEP